MICQLKEYTKKKYILIINLNKKINIESNLLKIHNTINTIIFFLNVPNFWLKINEMVNRPSVIKINDINTSILDIIYIFLYIINTTIKIYLSKLYDYKFKKSIGSFMVLFFYNIFFYCVWFGSKDSRSRVSFVTNLFNNNLLLYFTLLFFVNINIFIFQISLSNLFFYTNYLITITIYIIHLYNYIINRSKPIDQTNIEK